MSDTPFIALKWDDAIIFNLDPLADRSRDRPADRAFCQNCPARPGDKIYKVTHLGTAILKDVGRAKASCPDCGFGLFRSRSYRMKNQLVGGRVALIVYTDEVVKLGSPDKAMLISTIRRKQEQEGKEWVLFTGPEFRSILQWLGLATINSHLASMVDEKIIERRKAEIHELPDGRKSPGRMPCVYRVLQK